MFSVADNIPPPAPLQTAPLHSTQNSVQASGPPNYTVSASDASTPRPSSNKRARMYQHPGHYTNQQIIQLNKQQTPPQSNTQTPPNSIQGAPLTSNPATTPPVGCSRVTIPQLVPSAIDQAPPQATPALSSPPQDTLQLMPPLQELSFEGGCISALSGDDSTSTPPESENTSVEHPNQPVLGISNDSFIVKQEPVSPGESNYFSPLQSY